MYLPRLENENTRKSVQYDFRGYNHNLYVDDNEFYDEQNMTSKYWPVLSPRSSYYKVFQTAKDPENTFTYLEGFTGNGNGDMLYVDNDKLYLNGTLKYTLNSTYFVDRTMISYGGYVAIFPDKYLYSWADGSVTSMEITQKPSSSYWIEYSLVNQDGSDMTYTPSATAPATPADGDYWVDTSQAPNYVLKRWSEFNSMWVIVENSWMSITISGGAWSWEFSDGDTVTIANAISTFNGSRTIYKVNGAQLIFEGVTSGLTSQQGGNMTITRSVPDMDFVCSHNNRLWGCSNTTHEIYACKLGDPKNWHSFAGVSTDSYALTIPEETRFTGCVAYRGSVLFFKERKIYKVYGTKPSNFQLSDTLCSGVAKGCSGSICAIDEILYYAGSDGIYAYDGSMPRMVSRGAFDRDWTISGAEGGTDGVRYYVCVTINNVQNLFEYDTQTGLWSRVEESMAKNFVEYTPGVLAFMEGPYPAGGVTSLQASDSVTSTTIPIMATIATFVNDCMKDRYVIINGTKYKVVSNTTLSITLDSAATVADMDKIYFADRVITFMKRGYVKNKQLKEDPAVDWFAETGDISRYSTNRGMAYDVNRHYLSKIQIRTELNAGSTFCVALQYDHGDWEEVYRQEAPADESEKRYTYVVPIIPHRCDTVKMKLYGTGVCKIFAVARLYEQGSEI